MGYQEANTTIRAKSAASVALSKLAPLTEETRAIVAEEGGLDVIMVLAESESEDVQRVAVESLTFMMLNAESRHQVFVAAS